MIAFYENRTTDFYCRDRVTRTGTLGCSAHLHYHIEMVLFLRGRCAAYADTERYDLAPGDVFIAFPNQIHRYESAGPENYLLFIINPDMMPELSAVFTGSQPLCAKIAGAANDPEIRQLADRLSAKETSAYGDVLRRGYLLALFARLLAHMELAAAPEEGHALKSIVTYCTQNYTKELSLSLLESELHISKYYISHLFSDKLRIGFNDYINSLRVSFACRYLRESDKSVTEISSLVGFGTLRTFNRAFFKQTGKTPSDYRRAAPAETAHISAAPPGLTATETQNSAATVSIN